MAGVSPFLGSTFAKFSDWIAAKPDWLQNVIAGLILLVIPALIGATWKITSITVRRLKRTSDQPPFHAQLPPRPEPRFGFADAYVEQQDAMATIHATLKSMTDLTNKFNHDTELSRKQLAATKGDARFFSRHLERYAGTVKAAASLLEQDVAALARATSTLRECWEVLTQYPEKKRAKLPQPWIAARANLVALRGAHVDLKQKWVTDFGESMRDWRKDLDAAIDRYSAARKSVFPAMEDMDAMCAILMTAIDFYTKPAWVRRILRLIGRGPSSSS